MDLYTRLAQLVDELRTEGHTEDAENAATAMAYLTETKDVNDNDLYEALSIIADNAEVLAEIVERRVPFHQVSSG